MTEEDEVVIDVIPVASYEDVAYILSRVLSGGVTPDSGTSHTWLWEPSEDDPSEDHEAPEED